MEIRSRAIYRYTKGEGWCKHGIVHTFETDGEMYARDTYSDAEFINISIYDDFGKLYLVDEIKDDLQFIMMIDDLTIIHKDEFYLYDEIDRLYIPMGSWHERYLINKNSSKFSDYIIEHMNCKINSITNEIKSKTDYLNLLLKFKKLSEHNSEIIQKYSVNEYGLSKILNKL